MKNEPLKLALTATCVFSLICIAPHARGATLPASANGITVALDEATGQYTVSAAASGWDFGGALGAKPTRVRVSQNRDRLGNYQELTFAWQNNGNWSGSIRSYAARPLISFGISTPQATVGPSPDFPAFTSLPQKLNTFSFSDGIFSPPSFRLSQSSTPWVLFDDAAHTAVLSPASDFLVSQMHGNGKDLLASGLNPQLSPLPAGFTHRSFLVIGQGINRTFRSWGDALTDLSGKPRPTDQADVLIKYLGYWTDNGGHYYYNYDKDKGYAGTLLALRQRYREQKIPLGYLQLDSWWYQKSLQSYNGSMGTIQNPNLPAGTWNAYGGTTDYSASPALFPQGLKSFQTQIDLPLVVHARWLDPQGPYRKNYQMSGVAAIDPRWWDERMAYLKANGVVAYEQDWINEIYAHSPAMARDLRVGSAFTDNMARAAQENGLTLQYCMATPRFFLQGSKYANLTTIRTSEDRFTRGKWNNFLYASLLADALRIRPWTDVFKSTESGNLTIAALSSGPVGIGDEIGKESPETLMSVARTDGVLIKPSAPLLPTDATILADARGEKKPLVAATFTDNGQRAAYVFAYTRNDDADTASFSPAEFGLSGPLYAYDITAKTAKKLDATSTLREKFGEQGWTAWILAPLGRSGIAFLGDADKIVGTGRQRIANLNDETGKLTATVVFAASEDSVTLHGYAASAPRATTATGRALPVNYDAQTQHFSVAVMPDAAARTQILDGDAVKTVTVVLNAE